MHKKTSQKNKTYASTYKQLEKELNQSWKKLNYDIKREAKGSVIRQDTQNITRLLGECNFVIKELQRVRNSYSPTKHK